MYAIVDIETTGGYAQSNGITEISIHVFNGKTVVEKFESLINPRQPIPHYIQSMTGITNEMVEDAPFFEEVAEEVYRILHDKVFVAHNVNFDYSFVKSHLAACQFNLNTKKLCTVRLSRKIFPGLPSYSLGNLCHALNIQIQNRHRAGGDSEATAEVFRLLMENDREDVIVKSLARNSKEQILPPNVPKEHFEQLPYTPGVYYFHNDKGRVIYVGKAKNIRYRINSHFSNNSQSRQKQNFLRHTYAISCQPCATELMAHILESTEIKKLWPAFNYSQKKPESVYGIFAYEDQNGYLRLAIEKNRKQIRPVHTFHYLTDGHAVLRKLIRDYGLCPKLCFLQKDHISCEGMAGQYCRGACEQHEAADEYNARVHEAIASLAAQPSFAIIDEGLHADEKSCILVQDGMFYGMGYISSDIHISSLDVLRDMITPYKENLYIRNLVHSYAARFPQKVISFNASF